jgi:hypothetical protein
VTKVKKMVEDTEVIVVDTVVKDEEEVKSDPPS